MPKRNGTGPVGMGPCRRGYFPYGARSAFRHGYGRGFGGRLCRHYGPYPYEPYEVDEETRKVLLEKEKAMLEARLEHIDKLLNDTVEKDE